MQFMPLLIAGGVAFISAIIGGALAVFIATRDTETIGLGAVAGFFIMPSILIFILLRHFVLSTFAPHITFWFISLIILGYFYYTYNQSIINTSDDGSGLMALYLTYGLTGASLLSYAVLLLIKCKY